MASPSAGTPVATGFATSVTSMAVNMPATVNSGDRLVAQVSVRNSGTWSTIPTGFSQLKQQLGGGSASQLTIFEKIADGTEGGTTPTWVASTGTTAIWQCIRVTGAHASTASEVTSTSGDASAANPPSLTPSGGSNDYLFIAVAGHAAASTAAWSAGPSGYSGFQCNGASSGGAAVSIATATLQKTGTSEDPGAFTVSGSNRFWAAATIAVYPASGGAVNATVTQVAATVTASGGTQVIATVNIVAITQSAATVTATGGTQLAQTNSSNVQVAASITAAGGTQTIATVNIVAVTQSAGSVVATGGTQTITTVNNVSIAQLAATVTASGGTQTIATVNIVAISQVAATVTATGGTQVVSAGSIVSASITQVAANVTASGGTQSVDTVQDVAITQVAASVTISGGTQTVDTVNDVSIDQMAGTVTAGGGVQSIDTVNFVAISQLGATVTATGGTQSLTAMVDVAIAQQAANVIASGGIQVVDATSGETSVSIDQLAASVLASGGTQVITTSTGPLPPARGASIIFLTDGRIASRLARNLYMPL